MKLLRVVYADRLHEGQGPVNLLGQLFIALAHGRNPNEVGVPGVHLAQIGISTGHESPHQIEGCGRGMVGLDQTLWIGHSRGFGELKSVDRITAISRQGDTAARLDI